MDLSARVLLVPARLSAASVLLHSGADELGADAGTAATLHRVASGSYPVLSRVPAQTYLRALAGVELALGTALAMPFVPARAVGAALTLFSVGKVGLQLRGPGTRREVAPGPTTDGLVAARDVWLLVVGCALLLSGRRR